MEDVTDLLILLQRTGLALAIGFLVGIERGWKQREAPDGDRVAGVRTFALIGLLGGIAGVSLPPLGPIPIAAIMLVFGATFGLFQYRQSAADHDNSVTSTVAGLLVFMLGVYAAVGEQRLAAAAGVAMVVILAFKQALHEWLRAITWKEIRSALIILAATFIALPVLPDHAIDPWGVVEPRELWLLTILVAVASFTGYLALRALGPRAGLVVGSLVGAIVSSTAVTLDLARRVRAGEIAAAGGAAAAALATTVSLARVAILTAAMSMDAALRLAPGLAAAATVCLGGVLLLHRFDPAHRRPSPYASIRSPLDLQSVGAFAAALCGLTIFARIASGVFGPTGLTAFAATAGLADVDAATLAVGRLVGPDLSPQSAAAAILIAAVANQVLKFGLGLFAGGAPFARRFGLVLAASTLAGGIATGLSWLVWS
jgi:uncharacterized membrane protein (DUF4010 family)